MTEFAIYIDVAVSLPVTQTYTYGVPSPLCGQVAVGCRVLVPFGKRRVTGYILSLSQKTDLPDPKTVLDVLDEAPLFPQEMIALFQWVAAYYLYPIGLVIKTAMPAGLNLIERTELGITPAGKAVLQHPTTPPLNLNPSLGLHFGKGASWQSFFDPSSKHM